MDAIEEFLKDPDKDLYIGCRDQRDQDSKRSMLFHARRKYPKDVQGVVGIKNAKVEGRLFVVLYSRLEDEHYWMIDGKLVPVKKTAPILFQDPLERQREIMKRDGYTDEEIGEALNALQSEDN